MDNMVNTAHDAAPYEGCGCEHGNFDGNALYDAMNKAMKNSDWKPQVQKFEMYHLFELAKIRDELRNHTYTYLPTTRFVLSERGKTRVIDGEQIRDRVTKHALCDNVLIPAVRRFLIYDNGASVKGRGIDFARRRLVAHLRRFYVKHGNNGYILLMDYSKFYDNIRHQDLLELMGRYVHDDTAMWLFSEAIGRACVDVSYMSDQQYAQCMDGVFNSIEYQRVDRRLLTGEKYMPKHMNIGDQVAQVAGISYLIPIDNYVKIVRGCKYYARYMDDSYIIHEDREFLRDMLEEITARAKAIGITVNRRKTRICKLSDCWRFLQVQYSLTDTGRIMQKINPKRLTAMRHRMRRLAGKMADRDFHDWFYSWYLGHKKYMSRRQRQNMLALYAELEARCIQSN